jgi:hypothetical protein
MFEFKFSCPQCGQKIQCDAGFVGLEITCPACRRQIIAPRVPAAVPAEEPVIRIKIATLKKVAMMGLCVLFVIAIVSLAVAALTKVTVLKGVDRLTTRQAYRPPVAITVIAKTDSTNLRLAYAADQIIFNWEMNQWQLRVDGGPANGLHKDGAGHIPKGKYVTIKWIVTTTHQAIYVDGQLRYEHAGDYSQIDRQVAVFPANGSVVTVKSLQVKPLRIQRCECQHEGRLTLSSVKW